MNAELPLIAVVGPCASGKSALMPILEGRGYRVRHVAQEHSFTPDMWQQITRPDILIFLDVSYDVARQRRPQNYTAADFVEQSRRLRHAYEHADLYINTNPLAVNQVAGAVLGYLAKYQAFGTIHLRGG